MLIICTLYWLINLCPYLYLSDWKRTVEIHFLFVCLFYSFAFCSVFVCVCVCVCRSVSRVLIPEPPQPPSLLHALHQLFKSAGQVSHTHHTSSTSFIYNNNNNNNNKLVYWSVCPNILVAYIHHGWETVGHKNNFSVFFYLF